MSITQESRMCVKCVLEHTFPGITFNEEGLCNFCQQTTSFGEMNQKWQQLKLQMEDIIEKNRATGAAYDCVVAYSGGKDSSYILMTMVRDYNLRCLAVTIDNDFVSEQSRINCKAVTRALNVDHIFYTPATDFMHNMYLKSITEKNIHTKAAIQRASRICNSCINVINTFMIKIALQNNVSLIAGGYISGQVPKDSVVIPLYFNILLKTRESALQRYTQHFGEHASKYLGHEKKLLDEKKDHRVFLLNPMLAFGVSEADIKAKISTLGWNAPADTGANSSNCRLNDLGIAIHFKQEGFHPYIVEIAEQVRTGLMDREVALKRIKNIPSFDEVAWQAKRINLNLSGI